MTDTDKYAAVFTSPNGIRWYVCKDSSHLKLVRGIVVTSVYEGRTTWQGKRGTAKN